MSVRSILQNLRAMAVHAGLAMLLLGATLPSLAATFENEHLEIRDVNGRMPAEQFEVLARKVETTLQQLLEFWSTDPMAARLGKIVVELDDSDTKANYSFFFFRQEQGRRVRVVRVAGGGERPHHLARKLTSALFPNADKLIRNMMGEPAEVRFGNFQSFPMCGYSTDYWVAALVQMGTYIPLSRLGADHGDWGMVIVNNVPKVQDRAKQHASYIEAGSLGDYLIRQYGVDRMKRFQQLSRTTPRPWQEVFGLGLDQLEAQWLAAVKARAAEHRDETAALVGWLRADPDSACLVAQQHQGAR